MESESPSVEYLRISSPDPEGDADGESVDVEEEVGDVPGILDLLNFKVVPREPGDYNYRPNSFLPPEGRAYAVEYLKMKGEIERLRMELESKCSEHQEDLRKADEKVKEIEKQVETVEKLFEEEKLKTTDLERKLIEREERLKHVEIVREQEREERSNQLRSLQEIQDQLIFANQRIHKLEELERLAVRIRADLEEKLEASTRQHGEEKEALQKTVSERDSEIKEYSKLILEQRQLVKEAEKKLKKQENLFQQMHEQKLKLDKTNSDLRLEFQNNQETLKNLQIQLERQVEKCSNFRSQLRKTEEIVNAKEEKLVEAEGIIIDLQKVVKEGEEQKKQLEKIVQINRKLDEKVLNLEGGIRERQTEIERLERLLSHESQEHSNAQVRFRKLREHVFNLNREFSEFVEEAKSCVGNEVARGGEGGDEDDSTVHGKLDMLASHVQNKFRVWADNQKLMQAELAKTKETVVTLSRLLQSLPVAPVQQAPVLVVPSAESIVADPGNSSSSTLEPTGRVTCRDITRLITYSASTDDLTANVFSTMIREPDPPEDSALPTPPVPVTSKAKKHGIDKSKLGSGWFCLCGEENFESEENFKTHLNFIRSKHQFKCFIPLCSTRFQVMKRLKNHLWNRHNVVINPLKRRCRECGKMFPRWGKLYEHKISVHTVQRARKCFHRKPRNQRTSKKGVKRTNQSTKSTSATTLTQSEPNETNNRSESIPETTNEIPPFSEEAPPSTPMDSIDDPSTPSTPSATDSPPSTPLPSDNEELLIETPEPSEVSTFILAENTPSRKRRRSTLEAHPSEETGTATHAVDNSKTHLGWYCICGKKLSTKDNLNWHVEYFTKEWKFHCEECGCKQFCLVYLKRHYRDSHKMANALRDFKVGCSDCGIMFRERPSYYEHRRIVHGAIPWKKREDRIPSTSSFNASSVSSPGSSAENLPVSLANIKSDPDAPSHEIKEHGIDRSKAHRGQHLCKCGNTFKSKVTLQAHINYKNAEEKFFCSECQRGFIGTNYLRRHMLSVHNMNFNWKGCRKCGAYFETNKLLRKHMKAQHKVKRLKIVYIDLTTLDGKKDSEIERPPPVASDEEEEENELTPTHNGKVKHGKAGKLSCQCGAKFSSNQTLNLHIHTFTGDRQFECNICDKRFRFNGQLHKHLVGVHNVKNLRSKGLVGCRDCGRLFKNIGALFQHRKKSHILKKTRKNASSPRKVATRKAAIKNITDESIESESSIGSPKRSRILTTPPPLLSPPVLVKQEVIHEEEQDDDQGNPSQEHKQDWTKHRLGFFCVCGHESTCKQTLRRHISYYTAPDQFRCKVCPDRSFKSTSRLRAHMVQVHDMNFEQKGCRHCGQLFESMEELKEHQQTVHHIIRRKRKADVIDLTTEDANEPASTSRMSTRSSTLFSSPEKLKPTTSHKLPTITRKKHGVDLSKRNVGHYCICGVKTSNTYSLNNHINYFTAEWKFPCEVCHKRFLHLSRLKEHMVSTHDMTDLKDFDDMGKGCSECGEKGFRTFGELIHHRKIMHSVTPVQHTTRVMSGMRSPSPPKLYPQTTLTVSPPRRSKTLRFLNVAESMEGPILPPPLQPQNNQHGIDLSKGRDEHVCHCGVPFPTKEMLRQHILTRVQNPQENIEENRPTTPTSEPPRVATPSQIMRPIPRQAPKAKAPEIHKIIRVGKLRHLRVCYCGKQFNSEEALQEHVNSSTNEQSNQEQSTSSKHANGPLQRCPSPPTNTVRRSPVPQDPPRPGPSIVIQTGPSSVDPPAPPPARSSFRELRSTTPIPTPADHLSDSEDSDSQDAPTNPWNLKHDTDYTINDGLFYCVCGKCFHTKSALKTHLQWFTMERKFACNLCGQRFLGIGYLKHHLKQNHDMDYTHVELVGCRHCGEVLQSRADFRQHRTLKHPDSIYGRKKEVNDSSIQSFTPTPEPSPTTPSISIRLGPETATEATVSTPTKTSQQQPENSSSTLSEYFSDDDMIVDAHLTFEPYDDGVEHKVDHSKSIYGYFCVCGTECGNKHSLAKHVRYFSAERKFVCKTCGHGFLGPALLRTHMLKVHKIVYNISNGCKECGKTFITNMELYHHFRMEHNNGSQWEPREMKYVPPVPLHENQNGNTASANVPTNVDNGGAREDHGILNPGPLSDDSGIWFVCRCGKKYSSRGALLTHIRTLTAGKIFKCHLCGYRFNTHGNLKGHVTNVHGVVYDKGRYACGLCATTFKTCEEMKTHRRTVHEVR